MVVVVGVVGGVLAAALLSYLRQYVTDTIPSLTWTELRDHEKCPSGF
jgi:hypothetical protein